MFMHSKKVLRDNELPLWNLFPIFFSVRFVCVFLFNFSVELCIQILHVYRINVIFKELFEMMFCYENDNEFPNSNDRFESCGQSINKSNHSLLFSFLFFFVFILSNFDFDIYFLFCCYVYHIHSNEEKNCHRMEFPFV